MRAQDITTFLVLQGHFMFDVLPIGMKPSSDYFNPATQMLEDNMQKDNIKIVNDVAEGSETADGIRKKVQSVLDLCSQV